MNRLLIIAAALSLAGCFSDPQEATRVLTEAGYTQVQITGYQFSGCGKSDNIHTGFKAKGPTHRDVRGVVCSEWGPFGKSSTIRIN